MQNKEARSKSNKPVIITIDDDVIILNSILTILQTDYDVKPFTSGVTALKYLEMHEAHLILLDFQMPGVTGFDVIASLKNSPHTENIPVIFLTGSVNGDREVEALQMGAADYILKPFKPQVLLSRVRHQMELQIYKSQLEHMVEEKTENLQIAYNKLILREDATLNLLAQATDLRDHATGSHLARTTDYASIIVNDLRRNPKAGYGLTVNEAMDIIKSTKLHDIGKVAIPDHILLKNDRLTEEEFEIIKLHTVHGARLLELYVDSKGNDAFLKAAYEIVLHHHEKWDGSGYPLALTGGEICLSARIVAIADVYDALTRARPYKKAFSAEKSARIIYEGSGTHFDPYLIEVFARHSEEFERISMLPDE